MPRTKFGKWSFYLILILPAMVIFTGVIAGSIYRDMPAGNTILEDIFNRPLIATSALLAISSGLLSLVAGLYAIIKQKEKAWLVYFSATIGTLLLVFLFGEFLFPH